MLKLGLKLGLKPNGLKPNSSIKTEFKPKLRPNFGFKPKLI